MQPFTKLTKTITGGLIVFLAAALMISGCGRERSIGAQPINKGLQTPGDGLGANRVNPHGNVIGPHFVGDNGTNLGRGPQETTQNGGADTPANTRAELSREAAEAAASLEEVESANVLILNDNAYVAVVLRYGSPVTNFENPATQSAVVGDVSQQVKDRVTVKVKSVKGDVQNVYVSTNLDFVERLQAFSTHARTGQSTDGYVQQMTSLIGRLFPPGNGVQAGQGKGSDGGPATGTR